MTAALAPIMAPRQCLCCEEVRIFEPYWCCLNCVKVLMFMRDEIWAVAGLPIEHPDKQVVIKKAVGHIEGVQRAAIGGRPRKKAK